MNEDNQENLEDIKEEETEELSFDEGESQDTQEEAEEESEEQEIDVDKLEVETRKTVNAEDFGEDIDPDDVKVISSVVSKRTKPIEDKLALDSFISENPQYSKYRPAIQKYMSHPKWEEIPLRFIAAGLASGDLMKLGAKKEREAQAKADATKVRGNPVRKPNSGATDWSKASKEEFEAHKRRVLGQRV